MKPCVGGGLLFLLPSVFVVGCGGDNGEELMKKQIALHNQIADALEQVKDKATADQATQTFRSLDEELKKATDEFNKLPKERQTVIKQKYKTDLDAATDRMMKAADKANKKGFRP